MAAPGIAELKKRRAGEILDLLPRRLIRGVFM
jgi:hypothetical protein